MKTELNYVCAFFICGALLCSIVCAQIETETSGQSGSATEALNQFALKFLAETCTQAQKIETLNLALSPYTVWTVMAIINEGARKETEREMESALGIPPNGPTREQFRKSQQSLKQNIMKSSEGISLEIQNSVFTRLEKKLNPNYKEIVQRLYNVDVESLDFENARSSANYINEKLSKATKGRLNYIVKEDDLTDAEIFVTSALFFKGIWDNKFNKSNTKEKPFHNERKEVIGNVEMMFNEAPYTLARILNDKAYGIELPYIGGKMSMIVVLPTGTPLQVVAQTLAEKPFQSVIDALEYSASIFGSDPLKLYLPKFKISSDLNLNYVLHQMGIKDVFNSATANLSGISPDPLFLSRVIHKAEIEVDEDGTVASGVAVGDLNNKITTSEIVIDRPFLYFIYDKETRSIVFMGKYGYPK